MPGAAGAHRPPIPAAAAAYAVRLGVGVGVAVSGSAPRAKFHRVDRGEAVTCEAWTNFFFVWTLVGREVGRKLGKHHNMGPQVLLRFHGLHLPIAWCCWASKPEFHLGRNY